jgi:hypothetical protein
LFAADLLAVVEATLQFFFRTSQAAIPAHDRDFRNRIRAAKQA